MQRVCAKTLLDVYGKSKTPLWLFYEEVGQINQKHIYWQNPIRKSDSLFQQMTHTYIH